MRFLCLHGLGTNSDVLKAQTERLDLKYTEMHDTAALRYHLRNEDEHEYDFVNGSLLWPPAPGIQEVFGSHVDCYSYFDGKDPSAASILEAVTDLANYIASNGPFDAVIGFSQGAVLAATLIIGADEPLFKCAIFLCGGLPFDMAALRDNRVVECTSISVERGLVRIPVVNCWADNDRDYPGMGPPLSRLCLPENNEEVVHSAGHGVPSEGEDLERLSAAVNAILKRVH
ncbi:hypothetical protein BCON_0043g00150 [Botryotinia convoluta]|uniref:Serine hydrolase domain-containing protein n=1 Tax=Botryotinia convoluta TaxID=54673 RepID=A0A4Z1ISA8_9HELO|nr:hypothetical protein BCON_0043g00150 [Botryotinia convoluta]